MAGVTFAPTVRQITDSGDVRSLQVVWHSDTATKGQQADRMSDRTC